MSQLDTELPASSPGGHALGGGSSTNVFPMMCFSTPLRRCSLVVVLAREDGALTYGISLSPGTQRIHCVASGLK